MLLTSTPYASIILWIFPMIHKFHPAVLVIPPKQESYSANVANCYIFWPKDYKIQTPWKNILFHRKAVAVKWQETNSSLFTIECFFKTTIFVPLMECVSEECIYLRLDTTNFTIVSNYKLINVWRHVSAAHAAIIRPAQKQDKYLGVRTIWDPICLHVFEHAR